MGIWIRCRCLPGRASAFQTGLSQAGASQAGASREAGLPGRFRWGTCSGKLMRRLLPERVWEPLVQETRRRRRRGSSPPKKRLPCFARRFGVSHSRGDLTGFSPATCRVHRAARSCLRDWSSVARRRASGSGATSPAGFGAFALLDGPGLIQFRV